MTNEEIVALIQSGQREYEAELYLQNLPFIKKVAVKFSRGESLEDLIQQAYFGLREAVERYNPESGCLFLTYAYHWIRNELRRYGLNSGRMIRISEAERCLYYNYKRIEEYYERIYGRKPTVYEFARGLDVSPEKVIQLQKVIYQQTVLSLDMPIDEGGDHECLLSDLVPDARNRYDELMDSEQQEQAFKKLHEVIDCLEPDQRTMIRLRMQGLTPAQAGEEMGITRDQARSVEYKALQSLRRNKTLLQIGRDLGIVCWSERCWFNVSETLERLRADRGSRIS